MPTSHPRHMINTAKQQGGRCNNWTIFNLIGLVLNIAIFGFTLSLYHRIIASTEATPCIPDDNTPPVPIPPVYAKSELPQGRAVVTKAQKLAKEQENQANEEKPKQTSNIPDDNIPPVPIPAVPATKSRLELPPARAVVTKAQKLAKEQEKQAIKEQEKHAIRAQPPKQTAQLSPQDELKLAKEQAKQKAKEEAKQTINEPKQATEKQEKQTTDKLSQPAESLTTSNIALPNRDPHREFHIIFSTGCSPKQNWQAYVLYHSIIESGQTGQVTRIASGCTKTEELAVRQIHAMQIEPMGKGRFHLHLTPQFGVLKQEGQKNINFHYMNKPFGVAHWMENALGYSATKPKTPAHDDTIIMLLDPDMVFLRPIVNDFRHNEVWRTRTTYPKVYKIQHGKPFSQEYGYARMWTQVNDIKEIFPANELPSPYQNMTKAQITENYTAGPPYMATARDFYKIVAKWRQIAWPVQRKFPTTILAEMYSYSWAAAHLNLPHQQGHSFMVSAHFEDGFHLFKRNKDIKSDQMCRGDIPTDFKPHILHYCQRYAIGKYIIGKHRLPQGFVGHANVTKVCQSPLLVEPPTNVSLLYDYYIDPDNGGKRHDMTHGKWGVFTQQEHQDRIAFMLCEMIAALNRAATYFKQQHCGGKANYEKSLFFHQSLEITKEEYNNTARR